MLAESARRGGFECVALDLFGDRDTRRAARAWARIGDPDTLRLDAGAAAGALRKFPQCAGWIAGGGTDGMLDLLESAVRPLPLIGNRPETVRVLRTPRSFFATLAALGVPHPETVLERPAQPRGWLSKDLHGSGGWHIRHATPGDAACEEASRYFQRTTTGTPMSVLFVASGDDARIVGFNELIVAPHGGLPFVYRGAIGPVVPPTRASHELADIVQAIVRRFDLVGLNGIDFLLDGETVRVLEVNPRPSSSMALHDERWPEGLLAAHVEASLQRSISKFVDPANADATRGYLIVHAEASTRCPDAAGTRMLACGWVHDVPTEDVTIPPGAPFCSVSATGRTVSEVRAALSARAAHMIRDVAAGQCAP